MNDKLNLKQHDLTDWVINNYVWPKTVNNVNIGVSQRLLRLRIYNSPISARNSSSSEDSETNNHLNDEHSSNGNQHLVLHH